MKQVTVALDLYLHVRAVAAASILIARGMQVEGMVLLDPVDATPQDPESVLETLTQVRVATLIVGGGADDGGCSPGKCHFLNSSPWHGCVTSGLEGFWTVSPCGMPNALPSLM